jgi:hypothetical protein
MPTRYVAEYAHPLETRFRCSVELGPLGWRASMSDLQEEDGQTKKPSEVFWQNVDTPEDGKRLLERILSRFLVRNGLPEIPLVWNESERAAR